MKGKKTKMIQALHVGEELHAAITEAAERGGRRIVDHVRYVLEIWHGLRQPENLPQHLSRLVDSAHPQKKSTKTLGRAG